MKFLLSVLVLLTIQFSLNAQSIVNTFAGSSPYTIPMTGGYGGDGGPAINALLDRPSGITVDKNTGNIYFCDVDNNRVRKIDANGIITTIAGTGTMGHTGDGGLAINAQIDHVMDVAVDSIGNIYLAETGNCCVRKIDISTGIITTIAGIPGNCGFLADGGPATLTIIGRPMGIAVYHNKLYFNGWDEAHIRMVNLNTGIITTVAGIGAGLGPDTGDGGPATDAVIGECTGDIAIDPLGNMYIGTGTAIRAINLNTGIISTVIRYDITHYECYADTGLAITGSIVAPFFLDCDSVGNLYITESNLASPHIHRYDKQTGKIARLAGNAWFSSGIVIEGTNALSTSVWSSGIVIHQGYLYYSDEGSERIRRFNLIPPPEPLSGVVLSQTNSICDSATLGTLTVQGLNGSPPYVYSLVNDYWSYTADSVFTNLPIGTDTVFIRDAAGVYYTLLFTITVNGVPTANFTHNQIDNFNVNFTNTSTAADSVLWIFPGNVTDTATNPTFNFPAEGNYNVTLIAYNGCGADTIIIPVQVDKLSAIDENTVQEFTLYPNPAGDNVTIQLQSAERVNGTLQLVNVLGQVVYNERIDFNSTYTNTFDVSRLAKGLYVLCLQTEKESITRKLVIE